MSRRNALYLFEEIAPKGGIMQALYATPAWACCFYVFTYFTLFL